MTESGSGKTDWSKKLTKVGGSPYLETKYRIAMIRESFPDAHMETELIEHTDANGGTAVFKATIEVMDPADSTRSGGSATGWGSESYNDFRDYLEKAETKALGRAAAHLGYGTLEAIDEDPTMVARGQNPPRAQAPRATVDPDQVKATKEQIDAIEAWRVKENIPKEDMRGIVQYVTNGPPEKLRQGSAETLLFALNNHPIEDLYRWKKG